MNKETHIMDEIRLAISKQPGVRIFRNNVGVGWAGSTVSIPHSRDKLIKNAMPLHAGLAEGSSDLIGWHSVTITPDMVGQKVAVFTSVEVKVPGAKTEKEHLQRQTNWINAVKAAGGIAGFATSVEEATKIIQGK